MLVDLSGAVLPRGILSAGIMLNQYTPIEEAHDDEAIITEHPVDIGATMSDHIFLRPPTIRLVIGVSNSDLAAGGNPTYVNSIYAQLLAMKNNRSQLVVVYTGRRLYNNCALKGMRLRTNIKTEYAAIFELEFQQLLLVQSQGGGGTGGISGNNGTSPNIGGFNQLQSGNGPTQIPLGGASTGGSPSDQGAAGSAVPPAATSPAVGANAPAFVASTNSGQLSTTAINLNATVTIGGVDVTDAFAVNPGIGMLTIPLILAGNVSGGPVIVNDTDVSDAINIAAGNGMVRIPLLFLPSLPVGMTNSANGGVAAAVAT